MVSGLCLPAAVGQYLNIRCSLKKPFLISNRPEFAPAGPGEGSERLCVATAKHAMRPESLGCKKPRHAVEKRAHSFNRLVYLYFVKSLDHGFVPETGLGSVPSLT